MADHACDKPLTCSDRQTDVPAAMGPDFQGAATAKCCYHSRHGTCALTKCLLRRCSTTTRSAGMIMSNYSAKAPEYGALQTLREYGRWIEFAQRLECAVFRRFAPAPEQLRL